MQKPISDETRGSLSLQKYQDVETRLDRVNELRQLGLTEDEVELKLRSEGLDAEAKVSSKEHTQSTLVNSASLISLFCLVRHYPLDTPIGSQYYPSKFITKILHVLGRIRRG